MNTLLDKMFDIVTRLEKIETQLSEPRFYTIQDVVNFTGWSEQTVKNMFNRKDFPACDFGKRKLVEQAAFREYFSQRRTCQLPPTLSSNEHRVGGL